MRILKGERVRGSGGSKDCDGAVSRAVERQRMQVLCCCDCRSSRVQLLDCRSVGALEAMMGNLYGILNEERNVVAANWRRGWKSALKKLLGVSWSSSTLASCFSTHHFQQLEYHQNFTLTSQSHVQLNSTTLQPQLSIMAALAADLTRYCRPCLRRLISQTRRFTTTPTRRKHGTAASPVFPSNISNH